MSISRVQLISAIQVIQLFTISRCTKNRIQNIFPMLLIVSMFIGLPVYEGWSGVVRSLDISYCVAYYPSLLVVLTSFKY